MKIERRQPEKGEGSGYCWSSVTNITTVWGQYKIVKKNPTKEYVAIIRDVLTKKESYVREDFLDNLKTYGLIK